jgi:hypothetical protein
MEKEEKLFLKISKKLEKENRSVRPGKMMSSPGIKYKDKVFAFYHKKQMVFRLGKGFDPNSFKIKKYSLLNPFKNKAPMSGWFEIPFSEQTKWEILARDALRNLFPKN